MCFRFLLFAPSNTYNNHWSVSVILISQSRGLSEHSANKMTAAVKLTSFTVVTTILPPKTTTHQSSLLSQRLQVPDLDAIIPPTGDDVIAKPRPPHHGSDGIAMSLECG